MQHVRQASICFPKVSSRRGVLAPLDNKPRSQGSQDGPKHPQPMTREKKPLAPTLARRPTSRAPLTQQDVDSFFGVKATKRPREETTPLERQPSPFILSVRNSPQEGRIKRQQVADTRTLVLEEEAPKSIEDVPREILLKIMMNLEHFNDTLSCRLVSHRWCQVAKMPQLVRSHFVLGDPWRSNEQRYHAFAADWESVQTYISVNMRSILIDWLIEVHHEFELAPKTLHLGIAYLDRFLQNYPGIKRRNFQLIGMTCLWVASKFEDTMTNGLNDLVWICDDAYTTDQFESCELIVLNTLQWETHMVTSNCFLSWYLTVEGAPADHQQHKKPFQHLCSFLLEASSLDNSFTRKYVPSKIATSIIYSASRLFDLHQEYPEWLHAVSDYAVDDLCACVQDLYVIHRNILSNYPAHRAVFDKYMLPQFSQVAQIKAVNPIAYL